MASLLKRTLRKPSLKPTAKRTTPPSLSRLTDLYRETPIEDWYAFDTETTGLSIPHGARPFLASFWSLSDDLDYELINDNPFADYTGALPGKGALAWGDVEWSNRQVFWEDCIFDYLEELLTGKNLVGYNLGFDLRMMAAVGFIIRSKPLNYQVALPDHYFGLSSPPRKTRVVEVGLLADLQIGVHVFDNRGPGNLDDVTKYYCGMTNADDRELVEHTKALRRRLKKEPYADDIAFGIEVASKKDAPKSDYWMTFQDAPSPDPEENLCSRYALYDVFRTLYGWDHALDAIEEDGLHDQLARRMRHFPVFCQLPTQGIPLHEKNLRKQITSWEEKAETLSGRVAKVMKVAIDKPNPASPAQIGKLLYDHYKLPILKKTATQQGSTDAETLAALKNEDLSKKQRDFLDLYLEYKSTAKTASTLHTYTNRKIRCNDGIVYLFGDFKQTGTALTRCSSDNPNLQNIPKRRNSLRNIIGTIPGWKLVSIDFSQIEIRLFVKASGDPEMGAALAKGLDIHRFTASKVFDVAYEVVTDDERSRCKSVNFGILYGAGEDKIIRTIGNAKAWTMYQELFPNVAKYMLRMKQLASSLGEVRTLYNYRIWIAPEPVHVAVNCVVQGSAGDACCEAMANVHYAALPIRILSQVHDELIFLIPDNNEWVSTAYQLQSLMEQAGDLIDCSLPADPEYHPEHWGEGTKLPATNIRNNDQDGQESNKQIKRRSQPRGKVLLLSRVAAKQRRHSARR